MDLQRNLQEQYSKTSRLACFLRQLTALKASLSHEVIHAIVCQIKRCHLTKSISLDIVNKPHDVLGNNPEASNHDSLLNLQIALTMVLIILPWKPSKTVKAPYTRAVR